ETPEDALVRELREELGIEAEVGPVLIEVPQEYPGKRLRLEVRRLPRWNGTPRGREGQALTWVAPEQLSRYSMPSADLRVIGALGQPGRELVTAEPGPELEAWWAGVEAALADGFSRVGVRAPGVAEAAHDGWRALASEAVSGCRAGGAEVL